MILFLCASYCYVLGMANFSELNACLFTLIINHCLFVGSWVFGFLKYRCSAACSMAVDENQPERGQHVVLPQDVMRSRVWLQDSHTASLALSEAEQCLWSNVLWGRIALPCCSLKKCFFVLFLHWNKSLVTELPPNTPWSDRSECVLTVLRCSVMLSTTGWRCSFCML